MLDCVSVATVVGGDGTRVLDDNADNVVALIVTAAVCAVDSRDVPGAGAAGVTAPVVGVHRVDVALWLWWIESPETGA